MGHFNSRKLRCARAAPDGALVGLLVASRRLLPMTRSPHPARMGQATRRVVVTVFGAGLRSALAFKTRLERRSRAISAEDIGDFPDKNLSEALQRVTGVQISRQDGEGRGVSVRGAEPSQRGAVTVAATDRSIDFRLAKSWSDRWRLP